QRGMQERCWHEDRRGDRAETREGQQGHRARPHQVVIASISAAMAPGHPDVHAQRCELSPRGSGERAARALTAFTRVPPTVSSAGGGALRPHAPVTSPGGLTRGSIFVVRTFLRTGWIATQLGLARVAQL